jgi:hypothetical protein
MLRIQQKIKTDEYADLEELKVDIQKLLDNAFTYYKKGSDEHKAASELKDLYEKAIGEFPLYRTLIYSKRQCLHVKYFYRKSGSW